MEPIVTLRGVCKSYGTLRVLRSVDVDFPAQRVVTIVGPSGAGKTTLLQVVGSIQRADRGEILVAGERIDSLGERELAHFRRQRIGFVFQFHHLLPEFSALDNVCIPALIARSGLAAARRRASELLDYLGLSHRLSHRPSALSGGEQQRVAIARALMNDPPLILADEPSGNLDMENRNELHQLFAQLRDEMGKTFVVVTHDDMLAGQADMVVRMVDGQIASS